MTVTAQPQLRGAVDTVSRLKEIVGHLSTVEDVQRQLDADRARLLAKIPRVLSESPEFRTNPEIGVRSISAEIGIALRLHARDIEEQIKFSQELVENYPVTLARLEDTQISKAHTVEIVKAAQNVSPEKRQSFETEAVDQAQQCAPRSLRHKLTKLARELDAEAAPRQRTNAYNTRRVWQRPQPDGMTLISALVPAPIGLGIMNMLEKVTRQALEKPPAGDETPAREARQTSAGRQTAKRQPSSIHDRSFQNAMADVLSMLLLNPKTESPIEDDDRVLGTGLKPEIQVVTPVERLVDDTLDVPAGTPEPELVGYGLIDEQTAQWLASYAPGWNRIFVDESGSVLHTDRYTPSKALQRAIRARDITCRFPMCDVPSSRCETDHTIEWVNQGKTTQTNLGMLCPLHHRLKHPSIPEALRWKPTQMSDGTFTWRSPLGEIYKVKPDKYRREKPLVVMAEDIKRGPEFS